MKKTCFLILRILILAVVIAAEALAGFCVLRMDLLPVGLIIAFVALLLLLAGGMGALLFARKRDGKVGWLRIVIAVILTLAMTVGCLVVSHVATEFYEAMLEITNAPKPNAERNIYVLADNPAKTIADAVDYTFGTVAGYDEHCTQQVLTALETEFGVPAKVQNFESVTQMLDALYEEQVDAIILNGGYLSILEDDSRYVFFSDETRVLFTVPVVEEGSVEAPVIEPDPTPNISNTPFILYLSGQDGYAKNLVVTRSDVNILMVVNPTTKQILMVNTPRDYYVVHPWGYGAREKLTHCGIYGIDCSKRALEMLYDIEINYYAQINFNGFETLIDAIDGVTIYSPKSFYADEGIYIYEGENHLMGKGALHYSRDRYHQAGGDNDRGKNQMKVLRAVIDKVTTGDTFLRKYPAIFDSLEGMFATSMSMDDVGQLARMQLADMASWNVQTYAVTGWGDSCLTYSVPNLYMYVMHPNQNTVDYAKTLIQRVMDGEILTAEDMKLPE